MEHKNYRTVILKHAINLSPSSGPDRQVFMMSFNSYDQGPPPQAEDFGITDPSRIKECNTIIESLITNDEKFFKWLEADAKNTILFAEDPVTAFRKALPKLAAQLPFVQIRSE